MGCFPDDFCFTFAVFHCFSTCFLTSSLLFRGLEAKSKAKVQLMGVEHFEQYYVAAVQRAAEELMRQREREATQEQERSRPMIIKRRSGFGGR